MNILIIVAHGSRLKESNDEINAFSKKIQKLCDKETIIKYAFLELAEPSITKVLEDIKNESTQKIKIDILPYFLAEGRHVKMDIPNEIKKFLKENESFDINILPHIGKTDGLMNLLLENYYKNRFNK